MAQAPHLRAACVLVVASALSLSPPPLPLTSSGDVQSVTERRGASVCPHATQELGAEAQAALQEELQEIGLQIPPEFCSSNALTRQKAKHQGHDKAPERGKPVIWIHIHKSAGTTICQLAKLNDETMIEPSYNCDWFPYDTITGTEPITCQDRAAKFAAQQATWDAIEHTLRAPLCVKEFNYAILLRDPVALALSKANYGKYTTDKALMSLNCVAHGDCSRETTGDRGQGGHKLWWFFDNFLVRQLAGEEAMQAPVGSVTEAQMQKAVEVVGQMQVVLFLEDLLQERQPPVLTEAFGWQVIPEGLHANPSPVSVVFSQAEWKLAKTLNARDYAVYDHFRSLPLSERLKPLN